MPETPSTRGRATIRTPASDNTKRTDDSRSPSWSPERTPDVRPTTGASVTFGDQEQWNDYDTFSPESRPMTGVSRPTTGKWTDMSSRAMTPHTPGHLSRKDSGWTARTTGTAHTTATHTSDYSAWGMYSEGFAESEPPESWRDKVLEAWRVPQLWSTQMRSDTHKHLEDCTLLRVNAQTARDGPYRHRICVEEADDVWAPHLYLYVFPTHPEGSVAKGIARRYVLDRAEEPHRSRLRWERDAKPQTRDTEPSWCAPRGAFKSFFALPEPQPGLPEFHVDWTSAPDRYMVSTEYRPAAAWLRCFRFFAYKATKFHLLERVWPHGSELTTSYRLVAGHACPVNAHWRCLFAFFAFDSCVPNANQYTVQQSVDGYDRLRVGMTASIRPGEWDPNDLKFYAYDVPVPGTAKFSVQYRVRDGTNMECEQNRLSIDHAVGPWVEKFVFYGYPAPTIELEAPQDEELYEASA